MNNKYLILLLTVLTIVTLLPVGSAYMLSTEDGQSFEYRPLSRTGGDGIGIGTSSYEKVDGDEPYTLTVTISPESGGQTELYVMKTVFNDGVITNNSVIHSDITTGSTAGLSHASIRGYSIDTHVVGDNLYILYQVGNLLQGGDALTLKIINHVTGAVVTQGFSLVSLDSLYRYNPSIIANEVTQEIHTSFIRYDSSLGGDVATVVYCNINELTPTNPNDVNCQDIGTTSSNFAGTGLTSTMDRTEVLFFTTSEKEEGCGVGTIKTVCVAFWDELNGLQLANLQTYIDEDGDGVITDEVRYEILASIENTNQYLIHENTIDETGTNIFKPVSGVYQISKETYSIDKNNINHGVDQVTRLDFTNSASRLNNPRWHGNFEDGYYGVQATSKTNGHVFVGSDATYYDKVFERNTPCADVSSGDGLGGTYIKLYETDVNDAYHVYLSNYDGLGSSTDIHCLEFGSELNDDMFIVLPDLTPAKLDEEARPIISAEGFYGGAVLYDRGQDKSTNPETTIDPFNNLPTTSNHNLYLLEHFGSQGFISMYDLETGRLIAENEACPSNEPLIHELRGDEFHTPYVEKALESSTIYYRCGLTDGTQRNIIIGYELPDTLATGNRDIVGLTDTAFTNTREIDFWQFHSAHAGYIANRLDTNDNDPDRIKFVDPAHQKVYTIDGGYSGEFYEVFIDQGNYVVRDYLGNAYIGQAHSGGELTYSSDYSRLKQCGKVGAKFNLADTINYENVEVADEHIIYEDDGVNGKIHLFFKTDTESRKVGCYAGSVDISRLQQISNDEPSQQVSRVDTAGKIRPFWTGNNEEIHVQVGSTVYVFVNPYHKDMTKLVEINSMLDSACQFPDEITNINAIGYCNVENLLFGIYFTEGIGEVQQLDKVNSINTIIGKNGVRTYTLFSGNDFNLKEIAQKEIVESEQEDNTQKDDTDTDANTAFDPLGEGLGEVPGLIGGGEGGVFDGVISNLGTGLGVGKAGAALLLAIITGILVLAVVYKHTGSGSVSVVAAGLTTLIWVFLGAIPLWVIILAAIIGLAVILLRVRALGGGVSE